MPCCAKRTLELPLTGWASCCLEHGDDMGVSKNQGFQHPPTTLEDTQGPKQLMRDRLPIFWRWLFRTSWVSMVFVAFEPKVQLLGGVPKTAETPPGPTRGLEVLHEAPFHSMILGSRSTRYSVSFGLPLSSKSLMIRAPVIPCESKCGGIWSIHLAVEARHQHKSP